MCMKRGTTRFAIYSRKVKWHIITYAYTRIACKQCRVHIEILVNVSKAEIECGDCLPVQIRSFFLNISFIDITARCWPLHINRKQNHSSFCKYTYEHAMNRVFLHLKWIEYILERVTRSKKCTDLLENFSNK